MPGSVVVRYYSNRSLPQDIFPEPPRYSGVELFFPTLPLQLTVLWLFNSVLISLTFDTNSPENEHSIYSIPLVPSATISVPWPEKTM